MLSATQLRPGMVIKFNNELYSVFSMTHRTPGNLRGFVQAKMRSLRSGSMTEHRFSSEDKVEKAVLDQHDMEYLYDDGEYYYFMNTENYEQMHLTKELLGDATDYLIPQLKISVEFYEGKPIGVELPAHRRDDGRRDRTRPQRRHCFERHQARENGNRPGGPGASVHQRRPEDPRQHERRHISGKSLSIKSRATASSSSAKTVLKSSTT